MYLKLIRESVERECDSSARACRVGSVGGSRGEWGGSRGAVGGGGWPAVRALVAAPRMDEHKHDYYGECLRFALPTVSTTRTLSIPSPVPPGHLAPPHPHPTHSFV